MGLGTGRRTGYVWESIYGWHDPGTGHLLPSDVSVGCIFSRPYGDLRDYGC